MNDHLLSAVRQTAPAYGSVPFWSWNDRLDPEELRRQIRAMKKIGMHGFFMHARGGLETEYLSDEWFACIAASVDEAKKQGMDAWSYDENGWPSGFAGGLLLKDEDNHARYMTAEETEAYPAGDDVLAVYVIADGKCRRATDRDNGPYRVIRERTDSSYVDVMRLDITEKFIAATHEEYKKRLGADFGGAMPGFFTDEPQYYRYAAPYSRSLPAEFRARFGYDLFDALAAVFWEYEGSTAHRYDYFLLIHELYTNHFIRPIYEWCEANGCQLTGHSIEESSLAGQMMCCGGVMPFYQYEHIPGIDYLGRGMQTDLSSKQLGSVCAQVGRKKALSETFACCGWDVSPRELKRIAEMQYAGGVNLMCQHLYPYSERGQRKRDYPAHYSEHNPWYGKMVDFDRHFANLGALLGAGEEVASTLVVHPIRAAYRTYSRLNPGASIAELERDTHELVMWLGTHQVPYHFGDEGMMETLASVEGSRLRVGRCVYDYVVVPKMATLTAHTVQLLRQYQAAGGRLCFVGEIPGEVDARRADLSDLGSNVTLDDIAAAAGVITRTVDGAPIPALRQRIRIADGRRIIFTANITEGDVYGARMVIRDCAGAVGVSTDTWEKFPLCGRRLADGSLEIGLDLPGSASIVILEDADAEMQPILPIGGAKPAIALPTTWTLTESPMNVLTIDHAAVSVDGGVSFTDVRPIERVRDNLLAERYEGTLALRYPFTVSDVPGVAELIWENASVTGVTVNGHAVQATGYLEPDPAFSRADIAQYLRPGENEAVLTMNYYQKPLVYEVLFGHVMESLRNCLCFDTEIECVYIRGDFRLGVDAAQCSDSVRHTVEYAGDFPITASRREIRIADMVRDGLPFFGGTVDAEAVLAWKPGDPTVFRPEGRFAACDVWVRGEYAGCVFFQSEIDLAPWLREGENMLRVRVVTALRNTMGPHHRPDPEPYGVGPNTFSYECEWNGGDCKEYLPRYAFVKFGI